MTSRPKISVVGAGNVGSASAAAIAAHRLGEVYLYDAVEDLAVGKAMDINHASPFFHTDSRVVGCNCFGELADSDFVVMAAGAPRRAGMRRRDLLQENLDAVSTVAADIMHFCPRAIVLAVTNPVEVITSCMKDQRPDMRVFGLGCTLDTVRFRYFLAEAAGVSVDSVNCIVIGSHDDNMIPLVKHASVGGAPVDHILAPEVIADVVARTKKAGAVIVSKLKTRGSYYAASQCVAGIVEAMARNTCVVYPVSVHCRGHYGYNNTCLALPAALGDMGAERVVEIDLDEEDRSALDICASEVQAAIGSVRACS